MVVQYVPLPRDDRLIYDGGRDAEWEDPCDDRGALREAVQRGVVRGLGWCLFVEADSGAPVYRYWGAVVFDAEGRIVDNTGLSGADKATWLNGEKDFRWLCLANQTIHYQCEPGE